MRLVLDTNVVIASVLGSGAPLRLIELATEGEIDLFTSELSLAELAGALDRSHISRRLERKNRSAKHRTIPAKCTVFFVCPENQMSMSVGMTSNFAS